MRNWNIIWIIAPMLLCTPSCRPLLLRMKHVRAPSLESASSVMNYLERHNVGPNPSYVCHDSISCYHLYGRIKGLPETVFFDDQGKMILYSDTSCPGKAGNFAARFHPGSDYRTDTGFTIEKLKKMIVPISHDLLQSDEVWDLTVVIFWAKYCGDINRNGFEILDALKNRTDIKTRGVLVNMDFLKEWGMEKTPGVKMTGTGFP